MSTVYASKDAYLDNQYPTTNYGTDNLSLRVYTTYCRRALITFALGDISAAYAGTLHLTGWGDTSYSAQCTIYRQTHNNWVESQATWNVYKTGSSWTTAGGDYDATTPTPKSLSISSGMLWQSTIDVTDFISYAIQNSVDVNFLIRNVSENSSHQVEPGIYSRESGSPPYLTISLLSITTASLDDAESGVAYSDILSVSGGGPTYTWSITSGALPTGLSLNSSTGAITGTPSGAGSNPITFKCLDNTTGAYITKDLSITYVTAESETLSDLISSVTETIVVADSSYDYSTANNNMAFILNFNIGYWTKQDNLPFTNALYLSDKRLVIGARRDKGQISSISGDTFDGTAINSVLKTGMMNFGELDEVKALDAQYSEAIKRLRALFSEVKGEGNLTLTIYTEQDTTGKSFTITVPTTDDSTLNVIRTALSRDIKGKYVQFKITNADGDDFWLGEMRLKIQAKEIR